MNPDYFETPPAPTLIHNNTNFRFYDENYPAGMTSAQILRYDLDSFNSGGFQPFRRIPRFERNGFQREFPVDRLNNPILPHRRPADFSQNSGVNPKASNINCPEELSFEILNLAKYLQFIK